MLKYLFASLMIFCPLVSAADPIARNELYVKDGDTVIKGDRP